MMTSVVPESWVRAGFWETLCYMRVEEITDSKKLTAIKCFPWNYETFKVIYIGLFHSCSLSGMLQFVGELVFPEPEGKGVQCLILGQLQAWCPAPKNTRWVKKWRLLQKLHQSLDKIVTSIGITWCVFSYGWQQKSKHLLSLHLGWDSTKGKGGGWFE